jgi:hypothetical protein
MGMVEMTHPHITLISNIPLDLEHTYARHRIVHPARGIPRAFAVRLFAGPGRLFAGPGRLLIVRRPMASP